MDSARRDGFEGQRMRVVPAPLVTEQLSRAGTDALVVTDAGWFPRAARHRRGRRQGLPAVIVMVCDDGAGWVRVQDVEYRVRTGQVVVIAPGLAHEYGADPDRPWSIWWLHATGSAVGPLLEAARVGVGNPVLSVRHPERLAALVAEAVTCLERGYGTADLLAAAGAAWHLLALLPAERRGPQSPADPVARAKDHLARRLPHPTSVAEVAAQVGLSPSHLSRLFRAETGMGILQHQTRQRMALASAWLATTDDTIASIAHRAGYADELYFSRQFRRIHGVGPREYRRSLTRPA